MEQTALETFLLNKRVNPPEIVPAVLTRDVSADAIWHIESVWRAMRASIGLPRVEHSHWDWIIKRGDIQTGKIRVFAVSCWGSVQGAMAIYSSHWESKLEPQSLPTICVSYLEAAPWNLATLASPLLTGVGNALVAAAIRFSIEQGAEGRICLHSLSQSEGFYRNKLKMTEFKVDPYSTGMRYFEYNTSDATAFLERTGL